MSVRITGPVCTRVECTRPAWHYGLCWRCWHTAGSDVRERLQSESDAVAKVMAGLEEAYRA